MSGRKIGSGTIEIKGGYFMNIYWPIKWMSKGQVKDLYERTLEKSETPPTDIKFETVSTEFFIPEGYK